MHTLDLIGDFPAYKHNENRNPALTHTSKLWPKWTGPMNAYGCVMLPPSSSFAAEISKVRFFFSFLHCDCFINFFNFFSLFFSFTLFSLLNCACNAIVMERGKGIETVERWKKSILHQLLLYNVIFRSIYDVECLLCIHIQKPDKWKMAKRRQAKKILYDKHLVYVQFWMKKKITAAFFFFFFFLVFILCVQMNKCLLFHHEKLTFVCERSFAALIWRRPMFVTATLLCGSRAVINLVTRIHFTELKKKKKKRENTQQQTMHVYSKPLWHLTTRFTFVSSICCFFFIFVIFFLSFFSSTFHSFPYF